MKSLKTTDLEIGNNDIPISIYSAIDKETGFKQFSGCCNATINYKKICSDCGKEVDWADIKKGLIVGDEVKSVNTDNLKAENSGLRVIGYLDGETEENGVFKDGLVWFVCPVKDKKNKSKTEKSLMKFSYLREMIREFDKCLLGVIAVRGKEHIVLLKPYFNGLVGLGLYHFDRIRDIKELVIPDFNVDEKVRDEMGRKLIENEEKKVSIQNIENKREKLIEGLVELKGEKPEFENPIELMNF